MKKSIMTIALLALMTTGLAYADTTTTTAQPNDLDTWSVVCSYGSIGVHADARILFNSKTGNIESATMQPQWFGNLLAVFDNKDVLISASDATLYKLLGDDHFRWDIDNSDATVHILLEKFPFGEPGPNTINSEIRIGDGRAPGSCIFTKVHS